MSHDFDLFVIGAGSGGVRCARIAASHGARVAVAESRHWGGTCVNLGCVPKKLMVQASDYGDWVEDSHGFGWNTKRGQHDWAALIAAKDREIERLNGIYVSMLEKADVALFTGHATIEDAHTIRIDPSPLAPQVQPRLVTAARIVIAVGSTPTMPKIPGAEYAISSDQAFHLKHRPQRVCMVGGGYIGVEFAGIFRGFGSEVDLVYRQPQPLRGFDVDLRHAVHDAIDLRGIRQHEGASPTEIEKRADGSFAVSLDNGTRIETDCVFFATGRHPKTTHLGLTQVGVAMQENGRVIVDENSETSVPGIYAIGDVTNRLNLTPVAIAEGHNLADRLFGTGAPRQWSYATTPKAVFFTPTIASVGLTEVEAAKEGDVDVYVSRFRPMRNTLSGRAQRTFMKLVVDQASQVVVGAHMLGDDAPEIMQGLAIAVTARLTKADWDRTIGIHPTAAEEFVTMRTRTRVTPHKAD